MSQQQPNSNNTTRKLTACEEFLRRMRGTWKGTARGEEFTQRDVFEVDFRVSEPTPIQLRQHGRGLSNPLTQVVRTKTGSKHPDERVGLDHAGFMKCTGPRTVQWIKYHGHGGIEFVQGDIVEAVGKSVAPDWTGGNQIAFEEKTLKAVLRSDVTNPIESGRENALATEYVVEPCFDNIDIEAWLSTKKRPEMFRHHRTHYMRDFQHPTANHNF